MLRKLHAFAAARLVVCAAVLFSAIAPADAQPQVDRRVLPAQICNARAISTLDIASGSITAEQCAHLVDTQSDASTDDLTTVVPWSGIVAGQTVDLSLANAARDVVIKNGSGSNLIATPNGVDWPLTDLDQIARLRWTGSQWRIVIPFDTLAVADGGTVAAASNVITVSARRRYQLTASDSIQGVAGLVDGESVQIIAPATGTTTLVAGASPGSGQAFALSGNDKEISSDDEVIYTLTRVGSEIRLSGGGGGGVAGATVLNYAELNSYSVSGLSDGAIITVGGLRGGIFHWLSGDQSAKKTDDPTEGVWVAPSSDETGASGVWERVRPRGTGWVSAAWFNADGSDASDDGPQIQAALEFQFRSGERGTVHIPAGTYYTSETLDIATINGGITGAGMGIPTTIIGTHTDGPMIRIIADTQFVTDLTLDADATRQAAAAGTNHGILIASADSPSGRTRYGTIKRVTVAHQPGSGLLAVGTINFLTVEQSNFNLNGEHGMQFDDGSALGYTNKALPGLARIVSSTMYDNGGHGVLIGDTTDAANFGVRFTFDNIEMGGNALTTGSRLSANQAHVYGDQITFKESAFAGTVSDYTLTGGVRMQGKSHYYLNNRYLEVNAAIVIDNALGNTRGVHIQEVAISGVDQEAIYPAIVVLNGPVHDVFINSGNESKSLGLVDNSLRNFGRLPQTYFVVDTATVNNTTTLTTIPNLSIPLQANERLNFRVFLVYRGDATADMKFGATVPTGSAFRMGTCSGVIVDPSDSVVDQLTLAGVGLSVALGTSGVQRRNIELCGQVRTTGTAGDLEFVFAQNSAVSADTDILGESFVTTW